MSDGSVHVQDDEPLMSGHGGRSSAYRASFNVLCTVVGAGLVALPHGLSQSGWIGVPILFMMAIMAAWTAVLIIRCLHPPSYEKPLQSYGDIGQAAYGWWGRLCVDVQMHITLMGVSTVYLVLAGSNLSFMLANVPQSSGGSDDLWGISGDDAKRVGIIIIALIVWFHVFLKTLHEVGLLSAFNVFVAVVLAFLVIIEVILHPPKGNQKGDHTFVRWDLTLGSAFASFAFSYGAHPVLPSVYQQMKFPHQYNAMIITTFIGVLLFYLPMAIVGYAAYGSDTLNPIYDNICSNSDCPFGDALAKYIAILLLTLHVMFSYGIVINPTELALENYFQVEQRNPSLPYRILCRTFLWSITLIFALLIPKFGDILNLVSSVTNTFTVFILPCIFYMKLFWAEIQQSRFRIFVIGFNVLIMCFAVLGGSFGTYDSIHNLSK